MHNLRLLLALSFLIVFFGCVENEIERYYVLISVEPHGSASISPEVYGPAIAWLSKVLITYYPFRSMTSVGVKCCRKSPTKNNSLSIPIVSHQQFI